MQKTIDAAYQYGRDMFQQQNPQFEQRKADAQVARIQASQPQVAPASPEAKAAVDRFMQAAQ